METLTLRRPSRPIAATVSIPGSKSYTNRALVMAALAQGRSVLSECSPSRDCEALIVALRLLGVEIESPDPTTLVVTGKGPELLTPYRGAIDVGPAGTTMRFITALCSGIPGADIELRGSERMHMRPIKALVETLKQAGARIDFIGMDGCPPLRIHSLTPLRGQRLVTDGTSSSQFVSALLLASPLFADGLALTIQGKQASTSYIDMTLQGMRDFGLLPECHEYRSIRVAPDQRYVARSYRVEGDASGASYLWAIAAVAGGSVTVENVNPKSAQGDVHFPQILRRMGCSVSETATSIMVTGAQMLKATEVNMELMPDTAQTLAVVAAFARGDTVIRGLHTLRIKETDRIAALQTELSKIGIRSTTGPDYIVVHGGTPHSARISTYDDHRMAMSFAVCGAVVDGICIEEPRVVEKSFPTFWDTLAQLGITSHDAPTG